MHFPQILQRFLVGSRHILHKFAPFLEWQFCGKLVNPLALCCRHPNRIFLPNGKRPGILETRRILRVVSHFNLSVLANETLSVSLCREIDNIFGAIRTCFDHVLSKFSGFSWKRILFLKSACVNMVMQIEVQIGDTRTVLLLIRLGVLRI